MTVGNINPVRPTDTDIGFVRMCDGETAMVAEGLLEDVGIDHEKDPVYRIAHDKIIDWVRVHGPRNHMFFDSKKFSETEAEFHIWTSRKNHQKLTDGT